MFKFVAILSMATVALAKNELNYLCSGKPDGTMLVNPLDCGSFVSCLANFATVVECPGNLYFNQAKGYCDYAENVDCKPGSGGNPGNPGQPGAAPERKQDERCRGSDPKNPILLPAPDCNQFYMCDTNDWATLMKCPAGTHFSPTQKFCDNASTAGCA